MKLHFLLLLGLVLSGVGVRAQVTTITYQGRLTDNGNPTNGRYDLRFILFDVETFGFPASVILTNSNVAVNNGLFTVTLDFGTNAFKGQPYWLEIAVRTNGGVGPFSTLIPRQPLTPTPYAVFAEAVGSGGLAAGAYGNAVTFNNAANSFTGSGTGLTGVNASLLDGLNSTAFWRLGGNSSTLAGVHFLGTTDNQPFELKVNGTRSLRLEPNTNGAPNVIGGSPVNVVDAGVVGATISGGGATDYFGSGYTNRVSSLFGTIGGGRNNIAAAFAATIAGGMQNTDQGRAASIGGGAANTIEPRADESTISGGYYNTIQGDAFASAVGGGFANTIESRAGSSVIGGGSQNIIQSNAVFAAILGGMNNVVGTNASTATIGGGSNNAVRANARFAVIPGGQDNVAGGSWSFAAGRRAKAFGDGSFVWADSTDSDVGALPNQFMVRATGGVLFYTSANLSSGVFVPAGGGAWSSISDRNSKEHLAQINPREILERLVQTPIQTWNYKTQNQNIRHIGPMAQDFYAAFAVGEDDKHITTIDADGVALAAIQGLHDLVKEKDAEVQELKKSVNELKAIITKLLNKDREEP